MPQSFDSPQESPAPAGDMVSFTCGCGERLAVDPEYVGTVVICPTCRAHVTASAAAGQWPPRSLGGGRAAYQHKLAQRARVDFGRHTRLAGIALGLLMLATLVIPLPDAGGRMRMPYQSPAIRTTPGMLALVLGTWAAGALAVVGALVPSGLPRGAVFMLAAGLALAMPVAAMLASPGGNDVVRELRRIEPLHVLATIGTIVSIFALLAVGHAQQQIGGGGALRICQGICAIILIAVFAPLTVHAFRHADILAKSMDKTMASYAIHIPPGLLVASVFLNCVSLVIAGLTSGINACRSRTSKGLVTTSILLIYILLGMAAAMTVGIPWRAAGVRGLALGSQWCFFVLPRFVLASLAVATFVVACVRAKLDRPVQILEADG